MNKLQKYLFCYAAAAAAAAAFWFYGVS